MKKIVYTIGLLVALNVSVVGQAQVSVYRTGSGNLIIISSNTSNFQQPTSPTRCSCPQQNVQSSGWAYYLETAVQQYPAAIGLSQQPVYYQQPVQQYPMYSQQAVYQNSLDYSPEPVYQDGSRFSNTLSDISQTLGVATQSVDLYQLIRGRR